MIEREVELINRLGLHARAAGKLVRLASDFRSTIKLSNTIVGRSADAASILDLLSLGASQGVTLLLTVDGQDELEAVSAVVRLFEEGFDEI